MQNDIQKALETQLKNIESSTGKPISEWINIIRNAAQKKHGELVSMLKTEFGMGHGNANTLVHTALQSSADAPGSETDWLQEQYVGKENLKPLYDAIAAAIQKLGNDVAFSPKKAYMSIRRKKQFAIVQPSTKSRLDIGLNLKNVEPAGHLELAGSWNAMCTHRIKLSENSAVDEGIIHWLKLAYEQAG